VACFHNVTNLRVVRKSQDRLLKNLNSILSDTFLEVCRGGKTNALVRRRKMSLEDLVYSMINRKGLPLKLELRNYVNLFLNVL
jgi:23S rRNA maturation mini-RNase III